MLDVISDKTVFYIAAPANVATGGPELLHQLAFKLKRSGRKVYMYYIPNNRPHPIHENYEQYGIEFVREIEDHIENVLIVPEVHTPLIDSFKKTRIVVWWLSVDNYFRHLPGLRGRINSFLLNRLNWQNFFFFHKRISKASFHLAQSKYAQEFLVKKGFKNVGFLSDYLHESFLNELSNIDQKVDIVAYNPKKGFNFTRKLIHRAPHIKFVAIENMRREEVVGLLKVSKVYIDFGFHPGRDRIPREAAMMGCCVITNKMGSARFYDDVPIPRDFKYEEAEMSDVIKKIESCFSNFQANYSRLTSYRDVIKKQEIEFDNQVARLFG